MKFTRVVIKMSRFKTIDPTLVNAILEESTIKSGGLECSFAPSSCGLAPVLAVSGPFIFRVVGSGMQWLLVGSI